MKIQICEYRSYDHPGGEQCLPWPMLRRVALVASSLPEPARNVQRPRNSGGMHQSRPFSSSQSTRLRNRGQTTGADEPLPDDRHFPRRLSSLPGSRCWGLYLTTPTYLVSRQNETAFLTRSRSPGHLNLPHVQGSFGEGDHVCREPLRVVEDGRAGEQRRGGDALHRDRHQGRPGHESHPGKEYPPE